MTKTFNSYDYDLIAGATRLLRELITQCDRVGILSVEGRAHATCVADQLTDRLCEDEVAVGGPWD